MDYYKLLGLNKDAKYEDIKKAYKSLAMKWHPDKNNSPEAPEKFRNISEAYQVLSDDAKRMEYDNRDNDIEYKYTFEFRNPYDIFNEIFFIINSINDTFNAIDNFRQVNEENITVHIVNLHNGIDNISNDISNILEFMKFGFSNLNNHNAVNRRQPKKNHNNSNNNSNNNVACINNNIINNLEYVNSKWVKYNDAYILNNMELDKVIFSTFTYK